MPYYEKIYQTLQSFMLSQVKNLSFLILQQPYKLSTITPVLLL